MRNVGYKGSPEKQQEPTSLKDKEKYIANYFLNADSTKIAWSRDFRYAIAREEEKIFNDSLLTHSLYRPFSKQWCYFDNSIVMELYQMPKIFPNSELGNLVICATGRGSTKGFCAFVTNNLPDLEMVSKGQCFPLYLYEKTEIQQTGNADLFVNIDNQPSTDGYTRKDAISDDGLVHFKKAYPTESFSKEDMFYYIYGLLHSPEYRERYADNLTKELPRIPCVKTAKDFWAYSKAGRDLAELHIHYETVDCYPVTLEETGKVFGDESYYVTKMKFAKTKQDGKSVNDKTTVVYNSFFTIKDIPLGAYDYIVNGKPALEWVMERQAVTTDKKSGIVNDANLWATETMGNAKYPLELFQRVITVSIETMKIVNALPKLDID